ncbi:hypothetical protein A2U01_0080865, partial [Trifolium medium]|nr:hypothetical protein [Trifolium medium]
MNLRSNISSPFSSNTGTPAFVSQWAGLNFFTKALRLSKPTKSSTDILSSLV